MSLSLLFFLLFFTLALMIAYQDFKQRLISLWLLALYMLICLTSVYLTQGAYAILANGLSALIYFALIFGVLILYYFLKEKKFSSPVNTKIGLADIILFVAIGFTLNVIELVLFFSVSFLISALLGLFWFNRKGQTVPLGGILTLLYSLYYLLVPVLGFFSN